ncbi:hypothetical protein [Paraburkholderia phytofirmans]|uniref:hypothetical protein n=1 Tax=Paraburkholderia phytofirmans TaxID=261302 RepID=UPI0009ED66BD|nr:hypothetical protein [Paraburkholderia phytofirmans]
MPEYAAAPALPLPKLAHRPEPIEPPSPSPSPDPGEPDTIPGPSPTPDPIEPVAPPIGDPPPQPTQTPQARRHLSSQAPPMPQANQRPPWRASVVQL